jgi:hypothetical protein
MDTDKPNAAFGRNHNFLDCGGKRSATPLLEANGSTESGVAAALCHRSPNLCRPCAKLQDCITDGNPLGSETNHLNLNCIRVHPCSSVVKFPHD